MGKKNFDYLHIHQGMSFFGIKYDCAPVIILEYYEKFSEVRFIA